MIPPLNFVAALAPTTGKKLWDFDPETWKERMHWSIQRGVAYWSDGDERRILVNTTNDYLFSLDAATGRPDPEFGDQGRVDLALCLGLGVDRMDIAATSAPIVCRNIVIVGHSAHDRGPTATNTDGSR